MTKSKSYEKLWLLCSNDDDDYNQKIKLFLRKFALMKWIIGLIFEWWFWTVCMWVLLICATCIFNEIFHEHPRSYIQLFLGSLWSSSLNLSPLYNIIVAAREDQENSKYSKMSRKFSNLFIVVYVKVCSFFTIGYQGTQKFGSWYFQTGIILWRINDMRMLSDFICIQFYPNTLSESLTDFTVFVGMGTKVPYRNKSRHFWYLVGVYRHGYQGTL